VVGVTSRDHRSKLTDSGNETKDETGFTNDQATRVACSTNEMFTLWPPKLSGLSRRVVFYLGVL